MIEEPQIDELWIKCKSKCEVIFPRLAYIEIEFNTKKMNLNETDDGS